MKVMPNTRVRVVVVKRANKNGTPQFYCLTEFQHLSEILGLAEDDEPLVKVKHELEIGKDVSFVYKIPTVFGVAVVF